MVKILALRAFYAGQRPAHPRGISTNSARAVRDKRRFPADLDVAPDTVGRRSGRILSAPQARQNVLGRAPPWASPARLHRRPITALTCWHPPLTSMPAMRAAARGRAASSPDAQECPGTPGYPLSCRHGAATGRTGRKRLLRPRSLIAHQVVRPPGGLLQNRRLCRGSGTWDSGSRGVPAASNRDRAGSLLRAGPYSRRAGPGGAVRLPHRADRTFIRPTPAGYCPPGVVCVAAQRGAGQCLRVSCPTIGGLRP